ncbi:hypothetical protein B2J88_50170 [Rhodococcus sp. SRB_17]|nr:hypothetical protein [Rhodococcus sp. SRB_17]
MTVVEEDRQLERATSALWTRKLGDDVRFGCSGSVADRGRLPPSDREYSERICTGRLSAAIWLQRACRPGFVLGRAKALFVVPCG